MTFNNCILSKLNLLCKKSLFPYLHVFVYLCCVSEVRDDKPVFEKRSLVWEEDMQMHSMFLDRKVTY